MTQEQKTTESQEFFEIEGPEVLDPAKNFFDQAPFAQIIESASQQFGLDVDLLRRFLKRYADSNTPLPKELEETLGVQKSREFHLVVTSDDKRKFIPQGKIQDLLMAMENIVNALTLYPRWSEYVCSELTSSDFNHNGSRITHPKNAPKIPAVIYSYPRWLEEKLKSEKKAEETRARQILLGIDEVFPQNFADSADVVYASRSVNPATKRWRILKASNLTPERVKTFKHG